MNENRKHRLGSPLPDREEERSEESRGIPGGWSERCVAA